MKSMRYKFECPPDVGPVITNLNSYGISLVKDFLDIETIKILRNRFYHWTNDDSKSVLRKTGHPTNANGQQVFVSPEKAAEIGEPELVNIFREGLIHEIAERFFSPHKFNLNPEILLTHLHPSPTPILPWHFDRMQSLKFWIYIEDATRDDGAFEYCPGTHWEGRYRAAFHMATGTAVRDIPNDVPDHRIQNPVTLEAKAGDLIIFDPDGFHRGGVVKPGHERKVIRADTFPKNARKYSDLPFTGGWWLRSDLNFAKWFKSKSTRTLGNLTNDKTQTRERRN